MEKVGGLTLLDFKTCYKATVIKTVQTVHWHKDRHLGQWNRVDSAEINTYIYGQLTFDKDVKTIEWGV